MKTSPESTEKKKKNVRHLMDNNTFVFIISLVIAFFVWVAVAMYKSPQESYTIYNVPISIDTENSIVSQKGYINFWQSDEKIDVTVTGPRYLVTSLTPDDLLVSANLNTVDSAGISELTLKVSLRENSQDISITSMSKTAVEVYFDAELEKEFEIQLDTDIIPDHVADGYEASGAALTVTTVRLKGPETEVNKIENVIADPQFTEDLLYETSTIPVTLNLEGASAADTVSVNKYVEVVDGQEYFVKINIDRLTDLVPAVELTGAQTGNAQISVNPGEVAVRINTEIGYEQDTLTVLTLDAASLQSGESHYTVKAADLTLPDGVTLIDDSISFEITVTNPVTE